MSADTQVSLNTIRAALKSSLGREASSFRFVKLEQIAEYSNAWLALNPDSCQVYLMSPTRHGDSLNCAQGRLFLFGLAIALSDYAGGMIVPNQVPGPVSIWDGPIFAYSFRAVGECDLFLRQPNQE